jgi:hypothetical protein
VLLKERTEGTEAERGGGRGEERRRGGCKSARGRTHMGAPCYPIVFIPARATHRAVRMVGARDKGRVGVG